MTTLIAGKAIAGLSDFIFRALKRSGRFVCVSEIRDLYLILLGGSSRHGHQLSGSMRMSSFVSRTQTGPRRRSLRLPDSLSGANWEESWEVLSEDERRVFCRGWRRGADGKRRAVLVVLPGEENPDRKSVV